MIAGWMDRQMDQWKISPFYRTSSPTGAAAQKRNNKKTIGQGKGTADHLMPLGDWFLDAHLYMRVCPSVRPSVCPLVTLLFKTGKLMILIANNDVSCNHIIIQTFHHHEDASSALWALFIPKPRDVDDGAKCGAIYAAA